jgi:endonuclease-8
VQFDGPVLELMTDGARASTSARGLGPDVLAEEFDERAFLRRLREDDPTRGRSATRCSTSARRRHRQPLEGEGCFLAGVDPWRRTGDVSDDEALAIVRAVARDAARRRAAAGFRSAQVYNRAGRPCPRCGTPIRARGQGDDNRTTYWCPGCQR